jgi:hypothetical protein
LPTSGTGEQAAVTKSASAPPVSGGNTFEALNSVPVSDQWDTSAQVEIKTTEAVMRNILHSHLEALTAKDAWVPPLTVVLPIALALLAGVKDQKVENVLYVSLGAALLWLAAKARTAYQCRGHRGIDAVIDDLRPPPTPTPTPSLPARSPQRFDAGVLEKLFRNR